jgi:hypothetical protein
VRVSRSLTKKQTASVDSTVSDFQLELLGCFRKVSHAKLEHIEDLAAGGAGVLRPHNTVNWSSTRQTIDGFGAAGAGMVQTLTSAQMFFLHLCGDWPAMVQDADISRPDGTDCQKDQGGVPNGSCVTVSSGPTIARFRPFNGSTRSGERTRVFASEWSPPGSKLVDALCSRWRLQIPRLEVGLSSSTDKATRTAALQTPCNRFVPPGFQSRGRRNDTESAGKPDN